MAVREGSAWGAQSGDGREVAAGQTGDVESQARQLHKEGHGAEAKGGRARGRNGRAASVKSAGVRGLGSSSAVMKTLPAAAARQTPSQSTCGLNGEKLNVNEHKM